VKARGISFTVTEAEKEDCPMSPTRSLADSESKNEAKGVDSKDVPQDEEREDESKDERKVPEAPVNRRGSFTMIPDDNSFAQMGGFTPRESIKVDKAEPPVPPAPASDPPPPLERSNSTRPRTNSAMEQGEIEQGSRRRADNATASCER